MRRRTWLLIAIVLIAVATALMLLSEERPPESSDLQVYLPRRHRGDELTRMEKRRTLPDLQPPPAAAGAPEIPSRPRDPVLAAIANGKSTAVVIEANAIRHSPIGELLIDCMAAEGNQLKRFEERTGVDLLKDLDRVAMTEDGVVLSGYFGNARWGELLGKNTRESSYGDSGHLYQRTRQGGGKADEVFVTWGDDFAMIADSQEAARATIDRLEGRASSTPALTEDDTYGEVYGVLSAEDLAKMLPEGEAELALRFREAASRVKLHVDTSRGVGIVARVNGPDSSQVEDLGKALGGALALGRLKAKADGEAELAELMDFARVRPQGDSFDLELALPIDVLERQLAWCRDDKLKAAHHQEMMRRRERERENERAAPPETAGPDEP